MTTTRHPLSIASMVGTAPADNAEMEALRRQGWHAKRKTFSIEMDDPRWSDGLKRKITEEADRVWGK